jgi:hypothetical protein
MWTECRVGCPSIFPPVVKRGYAPAAGHLQALATAYVRFEMTNGIVLYRRPCTRPRDPGSCFAAATAVLNGELVFGQLETTFATRGSRLPQARVVLAQPACASALARGLRCGSGNHRLTGAGTFETLRHLEDASIAVAGAGENIAL